MKRYLLFAGEWYYPCGGMDDLIDQSDIIEDLMKQTFDYDWWHIYDTEKDNIIDG